jgi:Replication factor-A protein 1, N-terminal domain
VGLQPLKDKFKVTFKDDASSIQGLLGALISKRISQGEVAEGDTLKLTKYSVNCLSGEQHLIATDCELVAKAARPLEVRTHHHRNQ